MNKAREFDQSVLTELQALARFIDPSHEYSATARALVEPVVEELTG